MITKRTISLLSKDDQFVERLILYSNQYQQIQEELRNNYQNPLITLLKEECGLNRKWIFDKLLVALKKYQEFYRHRIAKQMTIPNEFSEMMAPIFEVRTQKQLYIASQSYEGAAKLRDQELGMLSNPQIIDLIKEFNNAVLQELKSCTTPQDYYTKGISILNILQPFLYPNMAKFQKELERICSKWLLNAETAILELSNLYDQELALAMIGMKKLKWEGEVLVN